MKKKNKLKYQGRGSYISGKRANTQRVTMISRRAKKIRKKNEVWTNAIKRATKELKKEGKL